QNHFELFGLPVGFDIDTQRLAERYRDLQRVLHPDRFSQASGTERRLSMQATMRVNEAFETLRDPLARALYLLSLKGLATEPAPPQDSDFLMDQMILREALAEARANTRALAVVRRDLQQQLTTLTRQLASCFENSGETALTEARTLVCKLQFLTKFRQDVDQAEAALEEGT
ncbi:MAG: Fe-S protein assembly co-chaperone HscB, partial [Pseudomonadota bacterium]